MELPELGKHCHNSNCKQLDFLPMKCDGCAQIFCKDHYSYDNHSCPEAYRKNFQVPVCPLCNEPVAFKRGEIPDIRVSQHIDRECKSDPATVKRQKIYTNRCNKKGCKTKELVKITCDSCRLTYCLKHRLEADHECGTKVGGPSGSNPAAIASRPNPAASQLGAASRPNRAATQASVAAVQRSQSSQNNLPDQELTVDGRTFTVSSVRDNGEFALAAARGRVQPIRMTEEEALARAMSASLEESSVSTSRPAGGTTQPTGSNLSEDEMLARAIAESEEEERRRRLSQRNANQNSNQSSSDSRSNCTLS